MLVKLSPLNNPNKHFSLRLEGKVRVYDKVLLTESEREADQLRNNDWVVFLGKKYSVEVLDGVQERHQPNSQRVSGEYNWVENI